MTSVGSDNGETSSRKHNSVNKMSDTERPLKKARFAWQVKGRYHMKDQAEKNIDDTDVDRVDYIQSVDRKDLISQKKESDMSVTADQSLEILGDYLLKREIELNALDTIIDVTEFPLGKNSLLEPADVCPVTDVERITPIYKPSNLIINTNNERSSTQSRVPVPVSLVDDYSVSLENQCLARWQARQMAKGFVDNTINRVLDSWFVAPIPANLEFNQDVPLDVVEFLDNFPQDKRIENEGILMAISAHGLHNHSVEANSIEHPVEEIHETDSYLQCHKLTKNVSATDTMSKYNSDCAKSNSRTDPNCLVKKNCVSCKNREENEPSLWKVLSQPCTCNHIVRGDIVTPELVPFHMRKHRTEHLTSDLFKVSESFDDNENIELNLVPSNSFDNSNGSNHTDFGGSLDSKEAIFSENFDFMDAAVAFAIQSKGLTSL